MKYVRTLATAAVVLSLVGCSAPTPTPAPTPSASSSTPSAPPTPSADTPQQFASIISGQETEWREVIKDAGRCRLLWVADGSDVAEETEALTCYVRELTIVMSTGTAAKNLRELTPSSDLEALVTETLGVLDEISAVDLEGVCGEAFELPKESKKCNLVLGQLYNGYDSLKTVLDKWKPYI